jgi:transposase-like protein
MSNFTRNVPITCPACGNNPVMGRESSEKQRNGDVLHECRWVCDRCGSLARVDSETIKK